MAAELMRPAHSVERASIGCASNLAPAKGLRNASGVGPLLHLVGGLPQRADDSVPATLGVDECAEYMCTV